MKSDAKVKKLRVTMMLSALIEGEEDRGYQEVIRGEQETKEIDVEASVVQFDFDLLLRSNVTIRTGKRGPRIIKVPLEPPASKAIVVSTKPPSPKKPPGKGGSGSHGAN